MSTDNVANDCARVREGGEVLERIQRDRPCPASMLGGPGRRTLFMVADEWRGPDKIDEMIKDRTGQVLVTEAPARESAGPSLTTSRPESLLD